MKVRLFFQMFLIVLGLTAGVYVHAEELPPSIPMRSEYHGENARTHDPVYYVDESLAHQYEVTFKDGKMFNHEGKLLNSYTWDLPSIYVVTEDQKFYVSQFQKHNQFHHSSLVGREEGSGCRANPDQGR